jgi:hypothetical protein
MSKRKGSKIVKPAVVETPAVEIVETPAVVEPVVEAAPVVEAPAAVETPAPVVEAAPVEVPANLRVYKLGKPYAPRNVEGAAHLKQGDTLIFAGFKAAIEAHGVLTYAAAIEAIVKVNPKNKAFLGYAVKRGWLVLATVEVATAPVEAAAVEAAAVEA